MYVENPLGYLYTEFSTPTDIILQISTTLLRAQYVKVLWYTCLCRDRVVFPAVTVCNMNRLRRSNLRGTQYESILNLDDTYNNKIDPSYKSDFVHNKFLVDPSQGGYANIPTYYDSDYDVENSISGIQDYEYDVNDPLSIEVEPFKVRIHRIMMAWCFQ